MSEIRVERLSREHIDGVMEISDAEFGICYKSAEHFLKDIDDPNVVVYVATIDGKVAGFGRGIRFGPDDIDNILKLPDSKERDYLLTKNTIFLFDALAVRESEQGKGVGKKLSPAIMGHFSYDTAVVMGWKNCENGHINVDRLLTKNGFRKTDMEIEGYWNLTAVDPEGYHCPVCGHPDKCFGVLYIKDCPDLL